MIEITDSRSGSAESITCLDDVPKLARRSLWPQRIVGSYYIVGLAPVLIVIVIVLKFYGKSTDGTLITFVGMLLCWPFVVAVYAFYSLFWGVNCPVCNCGFGVREAGCRSCGLPRHRSTPPMGNFADKVRLFEKE
jgi:hypothetical protein